MSSEEKARVIVDEVLSEYHSRSGLDSAWDDVDEDIQAEIRQTLRDIVLGVLIA